MNFSVIKDALWAAAPIMGGYIVLGLPCGLLCQQAGFDWLQVLIMSLIFYSGAGQYMIPNMLLAGNPLLAIVASVSLVNTRQLLYSASLSRYCKHTSRLLSFIFAAGVTDESFGVNVAKFENSSKNLCSWSVLRATLVNTFSHLSWISACVVGCLVGNALSVPTAIASFAMTSIFICLLCMQKISLPTVCAAISAAIGVCICKCTPLSNACILIGSLIGIACGIIISRKTKGNKTAEVKQSPQAATNEQKVAVNKCNNAATERIPANNKQKTTAGEKL